MNRLALPIIRSKTLKWCMCVWSTIRYATESVQTMKYAQQAHGIQNKPVMTSRMGTNLVPTTSSGGGAADPSLIQGFQELEVKCAYMESQVEEAQSALARKHTLLQAAEERAELAEAAIVAEQQKTAAALEAQAEAEIESRRLEISLQAAREDTHRIRTGIDAFGQRHSMMHAELEAALGEAATSTRAGLAGLRAEV